MVGRIADGETLTGQLPATQRERRCGDQVSRENGEGLSAGATDSTPHPNKFLPVVVGRTEAASVAHDGPIPAKWAAARQEAQRDHPGSMLSLDSGSAIKRITAGVKARRDRGLPSFDLLVGPSPSRLNQFERKKNTALPCCPPTSHSKLWPVIADNASRTAAKGATQRHRGGVLQVLTMRHYRESQVL